MTAESGMVSAAMELSPFESWANQWFHLTYMAR